MTWKDDHFILMVMIYLYITRYYKNNTLSPAQNDVSLHVKYVLIFQSTLGICPLYLESIEKILVNLSFKE